MCFSFILTCGLENSTALYGVSEREIKAGARGGKMAERCSCRTADAAHRKHPPPKKSGRKQDICAFHIPIVCSSGKTMQMFCVSGANSRPPGRSQGIRAKPSMLYLGTGGVAGAGPRRGSLGRAVRALGGQPAAAVRVAEALAVLFADLREQNGHSVQHVCQPATGPRLKS